ncbi:MAG: glycerol dehydratase reactivase beta/small subunit family protein [Lachnospiraceae bacterium]
MIPNKPSILIYTNQAFEYIVEEVCAGIEEEGLIAEIHAKSDTDSVRLSKSAAKDSIVGSGIGIYRNMAAFSIKNLPPDKVVSQLKEPNSQEARTMGGDSARAVKRKPFRLKERTK